MVAEWVEQSSVSRCHGLLFLPQALNANKGCKLWCLTPWSLGLNQWIVGEYILKDVALQVSKEHIARRENMLSVLNTKQRHSITQVTLPWHHRRRVSDIQIFILRVLEPYVLWTEFVDMSSTWSSGTFIWPLLTYSENSNDSSHPTFSEMTIHPFKAFFLCPLKLRKKTIIWIELVQYLAASLAL